MNRPLGTQPASPTSLETPKIKLFSRGNFIAGGVVGGPLAPIYFFYKNFKNQGNVRAAWLSIFIGLFMTALLVILVIILPGSVSTTLSRSLFEGMVVGITVGFFERFQAAKVKQHLATGGELYKSEGAVVVLICIAISLGLILGSMKLALASTHTNLNLQDILSLGQSYDRKAYKQKLDEFTQNDQQALSGLSLPASAPATDYVKAIDNGITLYNRNEALLNDIDNMPNIPSAVRKDDARLRKYTDLRLQLFKLIKKATVENSHAYDTQIQSVLNQLKLYVKDVGNLDTGGQSIAPSTNQTDPTPVLIQNGSDTDTSDININ